MKAFRSMLGPRLFCFATALQLLGLAVMAGGMLALGALTAPVVFGQLGRETGGAVMGIIFTRFDVVLLIALTLVWLGEGGRLWSDHRNSRLNVLGAHRFRHLTLGVLTVCLLYSALILNPEIARMNRAGLHRDTTAAGQQFELLHRRSEGLYKLEMLLAILLIAWIPYTSPAVVKRNEA